MSVTGSLQFGVFLLSLFEDGDIRVGILPEGEEVLVSLASCAERLATIQVATPGKGSEARILSAGNQNRDGDSGLAWTPDGKIVHTSVQ